MAVVVFDADVLIGFLNAHDVNHVDAVARVRAALAPGMSRVICAVNYSEVLIGPLKQLGQDGADTVDAMLIRLTIDVVKVDTELARAAAAVRAQTKLKLPDCYALATAVQARRGGHTDVRIASFDKNVITAYAAHDPRTL